MVRPRDVPAISRGLLRHVLLPPEVPQRADGRKGRTQVGCFRVLGDVHHRDWRVFHLRHEPTLNH